MTPIAKYAPDRSKFDPASSNAILNALPKADGWGPMKDLSLISDAMAAQPKGAISVRSTVGAFSILAGTSTKLYAFDNTDGSWTDKTRSSGGDYSIPNGDLWSLTVFDTKLYASNISDALQVYDIDAGGLFADASGSPPQASHTFAAGGYLCLANTNTNTRQIVWSGLRDPSEWTAGNKGSGQETFDDGGDIGRCIGDKTGAFIFQRDRIRRMQRDPGSGYTFTFHDIDLSRGAVAPNSVVAIGANDIMYLSENGFYRLRGGVSEPVGAELVDDQFLEDINLDLLEEAQGVSDPINKIAWFLFTGSDATRQLIGYDWQLGRWTRSNSNPYLLAALATPAYTLEALDNISSSIDALPYSLDSRVYSGGRPTLAGFDTDFKLGYYEGSNMAAVLETAETAPGSFTNRASEHSFRAVCDADDITAQVGLKDDEADTLEWSATIARSSRAKAFRHRSNARLRKYRLNIAAGDDWTYCHGIKQSDGKKASKN